MSNVDFDEHVREGIDLGNDHWAKLGYLMPCERGPSDECSFIHDEPKVHEVYFPRDRAIPDGAVGPIGFLEQHRDLRPERDGWCGGMVRFSNVPENKKAGNHQLVTVDPLHVEPSLLCTMCPSHGWVRDGRWSDA